MSTKRRDRKGTAASAPDPTLGVTPSQIVSVSSAPPRPPRPDGSLWGNQIMSSADFAPDAGRGPRRRAGLVFGLVAAIGGVMIAGAWVWRASRAPAPSVAAPVSPAAPEPEPIIGVTEPPPVVPPPPRPPAAPAVASAPSQPARAGTPTRSKKKSVAKSRAKKRRHLVSKSRKRTHKSSRHTSK